MSDERVWLTHPEHGGSFHCPAEAVEAWAEMGWEPAESPPEEHNPVIAENLAARAAEEQARAEAKPKPRSKTWSKTDADTTPEGN